MSEIREKITPDPNRCPDCNGFGRTPETLYFGYEMCQKCQGTGEIERDPVKSQVQKTWEELIS